MHYKYFVQIKQLTDKMNVLNKDLTHEKSSSEKQHKSTSDQLTQQTSENRKLMLEISKLKARHFNVIYRRRIIVYREI